MSLRSILDALRSIPLRPRARQVAVRALFRPQLDSLDSRCLPSFTAAASFTTGTTPLAVATGDFNNDDDLDLVTANSGNNTVSVRLGDGQGVFGPEVALSVGAYPVSVVVGDFDGDGNDDIATANGAGGNVSVILGNGDGTFDSPVENAVSSGAVMSLAVGDFNEDGKMDLAVGTVSSTYYYGGSYYYGYYGYYVDNAHVEVLVDFGEAGFASQNWTDLGYGYPSELVAADLDGDQKIDDVAVVNPGNFSAHVLYGNGDGTLSNSGGGGTGWYPQAITVGDFNNDSIPDLVTAGDTVDFLRGLGGGGFGSPVSNGSDGPWTAVEAANLNGDGNLDLIAVNQGAGTVGSFLGLGDGTFIWVGNHAVGSSPRAAAVGDFDEDGRADVAVANVGSDNVSVLLNDGAWPDPNLRLRINDVSVTEGHAGTVAANFTVTLSEQSTETVTVAYTVLAGSATAGTDYQTVSGTVTFTPGDVSETITVLVNGDRRAESNETFSVVLSNPQYATFDDNVGIGTITDDEPRITISDVSVTEGNNGTKTMTFIVQLSAADPTQNVTVNFATQNGTATTGNKDYMAKSGTVTFLPGQTQQTITITIKSDRKTESNEYFYLNLFGVSINAHIGDSQAIGWIMNDD